MGGRLIRVSLLEVGDDHRGVWLLEVDLNDRFFLGFNSWLVAIFFELLTEILVDGVQVCGGFEVMVLAVLVIFGRHIAFGAFDVVQRDLVAFFEIDVGHVRRITSSQEEGKNRVQGNLFHV